MSKRRRRRNKDLRARRDLRNQLKGTGIIFSSTDDYLGITTKQLKSRKKQKESEMNNIEKLKKDILEKEGWVEVKPEFDLDYFINLDFSQVTKELGFYMSEITSAMNYNVLGFMSREVQDYTNDFLNTICRPVKRPPVPVNTPMITSEWPLCPEDDNTERAFSELTYQTILRIATYVLGTPISACQYINNNTVFQHPDILNIDYENMELVSTFIAVWEDGTYLELLPDTNWSSNGSYSSINWKLYSKQIRKLTTKALINTGLELNPNTYQLGELDPEHTLDSFPIYIKEYTEDLISKEIVGKERFNILIEGLIGYGKTRWAQAFAAEYLSPRGYMTLVVDYKSLQQLVIPDYLDKVCLIINDADTLCLDRAESVRGETEQVLAWLDGTRSTFIKPFYLDKRGSIITIMTANSVDRWDEAALRKGRIHARYLFDQVNLAELNNDNNT